MIRHVLLFRFRADVREELMAHVLDALRTLPAHFPAMRRFGMGLNVSRRDQAFSHAMTVEFETGAELDAYLDSNYHEHLLTEFFRPAVEARAIASFEVFENDIKPT